MSTQMHERKTPLYIVVYAGEVIFVTNDKESAFREARDTVRQYISDHCGHAAFQANDENLRWVDTEVHELLGAKSQLALPYQDWIDEFYRELEIDEQEEAEREYRRFKELREKYEERFQAEQAIKRQQAIDERLRTEQVTEG